MKFYLISFVMFYAATLNRSKISETEMKVVCVRLYWVIMCVLWKCRHVPLFFSKVGLLLSEAFLYYVVKYRVMTVIIVRSLCLSNKCTRT